MSSKNKKASPAKKSGKSANKKNVSPSKQTKTKNQKETLPDIIDNKPSKIPLKPQPKNFKQIEYKVDENKLYLVDYNNNGFECNLFGEKLPAFNDNISGISSYKQRHLLNKIKALTFEYEQLYHPLNQNFEGYFPYPRPLSLPFINECANPSLFIKELHNEKRFRTHANQRIIKLKIPSKENQFKLTYLTSSIHLNETETKKYLLNLINNHINTLLKQNKFYEERIMKSKNVIALLKFKKILQSNLNDNEVNGKRLQSAPKEYKETFNIIKDLIHKKLLRKSRSTHKVMDEVYKEMYSIRNVPNKQYNTIMTEHTRNEPSLLPTKSTNDTQPQSHTISDVDEVKGRNIKGVTFHNITTHTATTGFGLTTNRFKQTFFDDVNRKEDLSFCKFILVNVINMFSVC